MKTNQLLDEVMTKVQTLIELADADADLSLETNARNQAKDDRRRGKTLRKIQFLLEDCRR